MAKVSKFKLDSIRKDVEAALAAVAKKHGIEEIKMGTIRYDQDGFRATVEARFEGGESQDLKSLRLNATLIGFNDSIVNATISYANKQCKVIGLKRTKLLLLVDGKDCTATIDQVLRVLQHQKSEHVKELPQLIKTSFQK